MLLRFAAATAALVASLVAAPAMAQTAFPSKPIRIVVPFGAGSSTDTVTRIIGQALSQQLGSPVIIENKPGADGIIAGNDVKNAAPDGHTLIMGTNSPMSAAPNLQKTPPYDPRKDFTPITHVGNFSFFLIVHPSLPVKSLAELVAHAKTKKLNYGTGNTTAIVQTAELARALGIEMQHIPYKTEPPAVVDLLANRIDLMIVSYSTVASHVAEGKLRPILTTLEARSPLMPDAPTLAEAGQKPLSVGSWTGIFGPAGMPKPVVEKLSKALTDVLNKPEVREALAKQAFAVKTMTPDELAKYTAEQFERWGAAIKAAGIELQ